MGTALTWHFSGMLDRTIAANKTRPLAAKQTGACAISSSSSKMHQDQDLSAAVMQPLNLECLMFVGEKKNYKFN